MPLIARRRLVLLCWLLLISLMLPARPAAATQTDIVGPSLSGRFGVSVITLPNGNVVVSDPGWDNGAGAVYLYNGSTRALISTLRGFGYNDNVGSGGIKVLNNSNFVVSSPNWGNYYGAVTWVNGTTGRNDTVSSANSLVGSTEDDHVSSGGITVLANGHYVVSSPLWNNGSIVDAGAVTWSDGTTGSAGTISNLYSLVGSSQDDGVGSGGVTPLTNGHYVVSSPLWNNGSIVDAGAATWRNGTMFSGGPISSANSFVGSTTNDSIGGVPFNIFAPPINGVTALSNGNYVVRSSWWDNGSTVDAGAVTWGNGATGSAGTVSTANSIYASGKDDLVGYGGITVLPNGNYVVSSPNWDWIWPQQDAGAVTWGNGTTGSTGEIGSFTTTSLIGATANDLVGVGGITVLSNGNYVVSSPKWDYVGEFDGQKDTGAVTWANGTTGIAGRVSSANSLLGGGSYKEAGSGGVTALTNGHYVVSTPKWGINNGAVTWGNGTTGVSGDISTANSLVGSGFGHEVGSSGVVALTNGHYVVNSPLWNNAAGAVTWANGTTATTGTVSSANSLVGSTQDARVGSGGTTALTNGNYVVGSPSWDGNGMQNIGAVTWVNGSTSSSGSVSSANSFVGTSPDDQIGAGGITALTNGNYVVSSFFWNNGEVNDAGAVTWGNGTTGSVGTVSMHNSLVGSTEGDIQTLYGVTALPNGNYVVYSPGWSADNRGAVSWGHGTRPTVGTISSANSVLGTTPTAGGVFSAHPVTFSYDSINQRLFVGRPYDNIVTAWAPRPGEVLPYVTLVDSSVVEGNSGTRSLVFTATLSPASNSPVSVDYATQNGTATAGSDYAAASGTLTFNPGETTKTITVTVNGDTSVEPNETLSLTLSNPSGAETNASATGTITNDDAAQPPSVSVAGGSVAEGNSGTAGLPFTATLSAASASPVTVAFATSNGTATAGSDYTAVSGTLTFDPGQTTKTITVTVNGDTSVEPNETLSLTLSNPTGATIGTATASGTILNDDNAQLPSLSVVGSSVAEGNSGTAGLPFTVTLSAASASPVTVAFATSNGTATAGSDYAAASGTITFDPGQTTKIITVTVSGDTSVEPNETLSLTLSNPTGATLSTASATGTITNDDAAQLPSISILGESIPEGGNTMSSPLVFTVTLSAASASPVTVSYATQGGTATAGVDYTAASGTLTFTPGQTTKTITVMVLGDSSTEDDETVQVALSNPQQATIATGTATGTIFNDDDSSSLPTSPYFLPFLRR